jgi:hypothetical protein
VKLATMSWVDRWEKAAARVGRVDRGSCREAEKLVGIGRLGSQAATRVRVFLEAMLSSR